MQSCLHPGRIPIPMPRLELASDTCDANDASRVEIESSPPVVSACVTPSKNMSKRPEYTSTATETCSHPSIFNGATVDTMLSQNVALVALALPGQNTRAFAVRPSQHPICELAAVELQCLKIAHPSSSIAAMTMASGICSALIHASNVIARATSVASKEIASLNGTTPNALMPLNAKIAADGASSPT